MSLSDFREQASRAQQYTKEGLDLSVEVYELRRSLEHLKKGKDYSELVKEIIAKEKTAVGLIQQATMIQRKMMQLQHKAIEQLIDEI